ncbi:TolC family protein [Thiolapillus brandeum]|uniref:TolC family protein n=1 Tax=Thiolapillus brandeum TaxID=1076588 RepID=UPI001CB7938C|nr:TolC family protein [Thiolapillus brandeum]
MLTLSPLGSFAAVSSTGIDNESRQQIAQVVTRALQASPEIAAAYSAVQAAEARLTGAGLPLNNPELEAEAENTDISTYRIGINQTIDWHDKRGALEQVARQELLLAQQQYQALKLARSTDLLDAIGRIIVSQNIEELARKRTTLLKRFERLAVKRHAAGDISRNDLELARLALAEAAMQEARSQSDVLQAQMDFQVLSGHPLDTPLQMPHVQAGPATPDSDERLAQQHPEVQSALIAAQVARQRIQSVDRGRKADPSFGLAAGQEGEETLVALSFSLPLQVRNNFENDVEAARAEALQADQLAQQSYRKLRARIAGTRDQYRLMAAAWMHWMDSGQVSLEKRIELLDTLWQSGELSTTDYLLQLQQTLDTRITGTELQSELWDAWVRWLSASGTLENWLTGEKKK